MADRAVRRLWRLSVLLDSRVLFLRCGDSHLQLLRLARCAGIGDRSDVLPLEALCDGRTIKPAVLSALVRWQPIVSSGAAAQAICLSNYLQSLLAVTTSTKNQPLDAVIATIRVTSPFVAHTLPYVEYLTSALIGGSDRVFHLLLSCSCPTSPHMSMPAALDAGWDRLPPNLTRLLKDLAPVWGDMPFSPGRALALAWVAMRWDATWERPDAGGDTEPRAIGVMYYLDRVPLSMLRALAGLVIHPKARARLNRFIAYRHPA